MSVQRSRLMVAVFSIFVPIFIIWTFVAYKFTLSWFPVGWRDADWIIYIVTWVTPILFIIGWVYFMGHLGAHMADALHLMFEESSMISAHYLLFYGVNTLILLIIFLIPLLTPFIVILAFASMIWTALTSRVSYEDLDDSTKRFVKIMSIFGSIPVIFCSILVIPESLLYSLENWNLYFNNYSVHFFYIIKSLGVALSIGGASLLYRRAAYEKQTGVSRGSFKDESYYLLELFIFIIMVFLYYIQAEVVDVLFYLGPGFAVVTFLLRLIKGRKKRDDDDNFGNPFGMFLWALFMVSATLYKRYEWLRLVAIIVSTFVFFIYYVAFLNHPKLNGEE